MSDSALGRRKIEPMGCGFDCTIEPNWGLVPDIRCPKHYKHHPEHAPSTADEKRP